MQKAVYSVALGLLALSPLCAITTSTWSTSSPTALWNDASNWAPSGATYPGQLGGGEQYLAIFPASPAGGSTVYVSQPINIAQVQFLDNYVISATAGTGSAAGIYSYGTAVGSTAWMEF